MIACLHEWIEWIRCRWDWFKVLVAGFIVIVLRGRISWCLSSLAACCVVVVRLVEMSGWELWLKPPAALH